MPDTFRIYVACLASYNNGVLHGAWINANQDADQIQEDVNAILRASRFPNVSIPCPVCADSVVIEGDTKDCEICNGRGEVPSAEEWAIHDYEGFAGIKLSEWESFTTVSTLAALIEEHGEAIALFYSNDTGRDIDSLADDFQEAYRGQHNSVKDYAGDLMDDCYGDIMNSLPDVLRFNIDYDGIARDLELGGDIWSAEDSDGNLHIFDNH